jgi:PIN domain nuclease of toxin-antitoxin system
LTKFKRRPSNRSRRRNSRSGSGEAASGHACAAFLWDPANECLASAASAGEIATKYRIGKFPHGGRIIEQWEDRIAEDGFLELPITARHARKAGSLPGEHRDPFDRMMAAQALLESVPVVSADTAIADLGAERVWK